MVQTGFSQERAKNAVKTTKMARILVFIGDSLYIKLIWLLEDRDRGWLLDGRLLLGLKPSRWWSHTVEFVEPTLC